MIGSTPGNALQEVLSREPATNIKWVVKFLIRFLTVVLLIPSMSCACFTPGLLFFELATTGANGPRPPHPPLTPCNTLQEVLAREPATKIKCVIMFVVRFLTLVLLITSIF